MNIYIFTAIILIFGLVIVFLSQRDNKEDKYNSNTDSTGGSLIDEEFSESSTASDSDAGDTGGD